MAKSPRSEEPDVEEKPEPEAEPAPDPAPEPEKVKTIEDEGIGAADPYPTGGAKPAEKKEE